MKRLIKYLLTLGVAALSFAACQEPEEQIQVPVNYTLIGDTAFNKDLKANFKVVADKALEQDVTVNIILEEGSNFPESNLDYPKTIQIAAGAKEVSATVAIKDRLALEAGVDYLVSLAAEVNGVVSVQKIVLKYSRQNLNGSWSAIGTLSGTNWDTDFVLKEGKDGWYSVEGVEAYAGEEFKFRKDGGWDVNFGGAAAEGEFSVVLGGDNLKFEKDGVYTLALNPNAEKGKIVRTADIVVKYAFTAPEKFDDNFKAALKVTSDHIAREDITINLALDSKTTFPENSLTVPATLTIAKGATEGTAEVVMNPESLTPGGEYAAVVMATLGNDAIGTATIGYTKPDLNGAWSVIGSIGGTNWDKDFEMTGQDGLYTVEGIEARAGEEFKFRRDAKWDLAFGIPEKGTPELGVEFAVTSVAGAPNIVIGEDGVYTLSLNPNKAVAKMVKTGDLVKIYTLADLVALMPETNKEKAEFKGILNDIVVTYVSGSNIFLEDATSAMLLYKSNTGLQAGVKLSGYFEGKVQNYNGLPEISDLSYNQTDITIGQAEVPAPAEMTIGQVLTNFNSLISKRVKLTNVYAADDIKNKGEYSIFQGEDNIAFYTNVNLEKGFKKGSIFDVIAIVTPYNEKKQVKIFEEKAITRLIPVMTMSDIQALCKSTTNASFAGVFEGLYVNYILGTDHMYLEDASGALRYYKAGGAGLKVGDKISGVITGTCQKGSDGRPVINWLDRTYATVTAAPAEEQPKPVTGTLASFTDVNGLMYRRVKLENVVLDATTPTDKSSFITTISDDTGTFPLHVRFKPSQALPKGTKLSFTGTFDVDSKGQLEIRLFKQNEITGMTLPE